MGVARNYVSFLLCGKLRMSWLLSGTKSISVLINEMKVTDYLITGVAMVTLIGNNQEHFSAVNYSLMNSIFRIFNRKKLQKFFKKEFSFFFTGTDQCSGSYLSWQYHYFSSVFVCWTLYNVTHKTLEGFKLDYLRIAGVAKQRIHDISSQPINKKLTWKSFQILSMTSVSTDVIFICWRARAISQDCLNWKRVSRWCIFFFWILLQTNIQTT